jgi:hypothetical protein
VRARRWSGTKRTMQGGIRPAVGDNALLKGGGGTRAEGESEAWGDAWGRVGARERGASVLPRVPLLRALPS